MKTLKNWIIVLLLWCIFPTSLLGQKIVQTIRVEQSYSPKNDIRSIQFDTDGTMWIGTADGVLKKERKKDFEWNTALGSRYVKDIKIDTNKHLWVSCWLAGVHQSQDKGQTWTQAAEFGNAPVMCLLTDKNGVNYVATWGMGIYKYTNGWKKVGEERTYEKGVNAILKDSNGYLWIATYLGLVQYDESKDIPQIYTTRNSLLPSNNIYKLALDKQRNVWAGTDGGLMNVTKKQIYTTRNSQLPALSILSLYGPENKDGIWIGTSKGLAFFNKKGWRIWDTRNSELIGDKVQCIVENEGKIYIGTDKGINVIVP